MPFRRFFERGAKDAPAAPAPAATDEFSDETAAVAEQEPEETGEPEVPAEHDEADFRDRAAAVLPTGASTGSKRVAALYGADDAVGPTHYVRAIGCRVTDADGYEYLDCTMALGAVSLGYAEPNVTRAVVDAIAGGNVSALSSVSEVDVAERLCGVLRKKRDNCSSRGNDQCNQQ